MVGPLTWAALFASEPPPGLAEAALREARARVGVRERPLGSNSGPEVDGYLARVGLEPGHPWCLAFVYYCVDEAAKRLGVPNPLLRTASCSRLYRWAREDGRLVPVPAPGDIFSASVGRQGTTMPAL